MFRLAGIVEIGKKGVKIKKIDPKTIPWGGRGRPSAETIAIRELVEGEAIRFKCRWEHKSTRDTRVKNPSGKSIQCHGSTFSTQVARLKGFKVTVTCTDGYLYVYRGEPYFESQEISQTKQTAIELLKGDRY